MSSTHKRGDLAIDQRLALATAARRLAEAFAGTFGAETIERFLHTSYDQFAGKAVVPHYLPLLAERFARQRLHALARVEGHHDGRPIDACPVYPGKRYLNWELDDPAGKSVEDIRPIRDEIEHRVRRLLADLEIPASRTPGIEAQ
ncbi:three-helix bundle dimerization domain-containing protein [Nonomuraea sp. NPDC050478]|uniref:three-helix bundle dimerization domain-containing protein n=1 Tax=Nonomuraea sp. NPDC050478 TaxID=3364365 RepID=UPI00379E3F2C